MEPDEICEDFKITEEYFIKTEQTQELNKRKTKNNGDIFIDEKNGEPLYKRLSGVLFLFVLDRCYRL